MNRDLLIALTEAPTIEEVWALHTDCMSGYGFDRLFYGYTRFLTPNSYGDPQDLLVLTNHNPEYATPFVQEGMVHHAPMVRWARDNEGAASWSMMEDWGRSGALTHKEKEVIAFNRQHNVTTGVTISFRSVSVRSKGAIALTGKPDMSQTDVDAVWNEHREDLLLVNNVAHLKIISLPYFGTRRQLTRRQREALEWVVDVKTTADIAQIMGLTSATIEKHLRLAREALDVETTAQAVLKASVQNQIFILETV